MPTKPQPAPPSTVVITFRDERRPPLILPGHRLQTTNAEGRLVRVDLYRVPDPTEPDLASFVGSVPGEVILSALDLIDPALVAPLALPSTAA